MGEALKLPKIPPRITKNVTITKNVFTQYNIKTIILNIETRQIKKYLENRNKNNKKQQITNSNI